MYLNRILIFSITKKQQKIARNLYAHALTLQKTLKETIIMLKLRSLV